MSDDKTASQLIEEGVGLIAQGMYRKADREKNPQAAYEDGMAAVNVIRHMAFDFLKKSNRT